MYVQSRHRKHTETYVRVTGPRAVTKVLSLESIKDLLDGHGYLYSMRRENILVFIDGEMFSLDYAKVGMSDEENLRYDK